MDILFHQFFTFQGPSLKCSYLLHSVRKAMLQESRQNVHKSSNHDLVLTQCSNNFWQGWTLIWNESYTVQRSMLSDDWSSTQVITKRVMDSHFSFFPFHSVTPQFISYPCVTVGTHAHFVCVDTSSPRDGEPAESDGKNENEAKWPVTC